MMIQRVGAPGWPNFALTFSRNISTSAAWSGQNLVKRNAGTRLGKLCCRRPVESQNVLASWFRSYRELHAVGPGQSLTPPPLSKNSPQSVFSNFWEDSRDTMSGGHIILKYLSIVFWFCCSKFYDGKIIVPWGDSKSITIILLEFD